MKTSQIASSETSSESQSPLQGSQKKALKERVKLFLKFALVGFVFYYLYQKGLITGESFRRMFASPGVVLTCTLLIAINTLLGVARWKLLLASQGAHLKFSRVLQLNLIGNFFNIALPGAVSGDFIKAIYVSKQFKEKRAAVFGSMVFDRLLGVSAMIFVGGISALLSTIIPWGGQLPPVLLYSIGGLSLFFVLFYVYLFTSHKRDPLFWLLQIFTRRHEKLQAIDRLYQGVMSYRNHPRRVLRSLPLSIMIHIILVLMAFFLTRAISTDPISIVALAVIVPIGMLATTIPVLPAGVGTGHAAFYALYKLVGSEQGAEVFSLIVLYQVLVGLIGGVAYLKLSAEK